jgi:hypothetical protein
LAARWGALTDEVCALLHGMLRVGGVGHAAHLQWQNA